MTDISIYIDFIRSRITELRLKKDVSEHRMSLDLGKSGSYIRGITSNGAMPSVKELFNIIDYFDMNPAEFFAPLADDQSQLAKICERLQQLDEAELKKIDTFVSWIANGNEE